MAGLLLSPCGKSAAGADGLPDTVTGAAACSEGAVTTAKGEDAGRSRDSDAAAVGLLVGYSVGKLRP